MGRWKQWKLLTGDHDKNDGWFKPDTSRYFKKKNGRYPAKAYEPLNEEFCGDECDDVILPRRLPFCFKPSFHSLQSGAKGVLDVFMDEKINPTVNMSLHPADRLVQLYNIEDDPNETTEISDEYPLIVHQMLAKLADYYDKQTKPFYPKEDPGADPVLH